MPRVNKLSWLVAHDLSGFTWNPMRISNETDEMLIGNQKNEI